MDETYSDVALCPLHWRSGFIRLRITGILARLIEIRVDKMISDNHVIESLDELETFLRLIETGALGLDNVSGIALATNNANGRPFVAVLDDNQQLLLGRWVSQEVFENGKDMVRYGTKKPH